MLVQPYLFFDGRCEEVLEFYRSVLGEGGQGQMALAKTFLPRPSAWWPTACRG